MRGGIADLNRRIALGGRHSPQTGSSTKVRTEEDRVALCRPARRANDFRTYRRHQSILRAIFVHDAYFFRNSSAAAAYKKNMIRIRGKCGGAIFGGRRRTGQRTHRAIANGKEIERASAVEGDPLPVGRPVEFAAFRRHAVSVELRLCSARGGYREQSEIRVCPARKRDCLSVWRANRVAVVPVASELDLIVGADLLGKDPGILVCSPARKRNALAIGRKRRFPGIFV